MLLCTAGSMASDVVLDRRAWKDEEMHIAGSSYVYFWRRDSVKDRDDKTSGATYQNALNLQQDGLAIDINCLPGHPYQGAYANRAWPSHPIMGRTNVVFIDASVRSHPNDEFVLYPPGDLLHEWAWWDEIHRRR